MFKDYYSENLVELPKDAKFRQYKFSMDGKGFTKIQRKITDPKTLQKYLVMYSPSAVYQSVACFLHPELVGIKGAEYQITNAINKMKIGKSMENDIIGKKYREMFLYSSLVLDFDAHNGESLYSPYQNMLSAWKELKKEGYQDFEFVRTGRGFHLWVNDWEKIVRDIPKPHDRIQADTNARKAIVERLKKKKIEMDEGITLDVWRIVRVPGSLHRNGTVIYKTKDINDKKLLNPEVHSYIVTCQSERAHEKILITC